MAKPFLERRGSNTPTNTQRRRGAMSSSTLAFALAVPACSFLRAPSSHRAIFIHPVRSPRTHARRARMCDTPPEPTAEVPAPIPPPTAQGPFSALRAWVKRISAKQAGQKAAVLRSYGLAAILSYGMFDALTYSLSFLFSLRAYIAAGKTLTWGTLPQVLALMWGINNLSRPFRIAGALALAPIVDRRVVKPFGSFLTRLRRGDSAS